MNQGNYDVIVIGLGGMGSAATFELARRGQRVLGLEQHSLVHDQGSSHGQTRITRRAYYEHPDYVPLVQRAFERWYDLEQRVGRHLLTECPCLTIGRADSRLITGVQQSAREHKLAVESLSHAELRQRFPMFQPPEDMVGVIERSAGFLYVEECVRAHLDAARALGATLQEKEPVLSWQANRDHVEVTTVKGRYHAERLILTAGPWAGQLLARWGANLRVMRQVAFWFGTRDDKWHRRDRFPLFIAETPGGHFYGFPVLNSDGLKVAQHYGAPELLDPALIDRTVHPDDEKPVRAFLRQFLPGVDGDRRRGSVCTYTLSPDRHFIIDRHPEHESVAFAAGFSGHGFKFASVVGEILADLAENGQTELPIGMFRIGRFQ